MSTIYMLDTVIFNRALDDQAVYIALSELQLRATHIQIDEIKQTKNEDRRLKLLDTFKTLEPQKVRTSSLVWDVSRWDDANWGQQDGLFERMLDALKRADEAAKKKPRNTNNQLNDILIAETTIRNGFILISEDQPTILHCKTVWRSGSFVGRDRRMSRRLQSTRRASLFGIIQLGTARP